MTTQAALTQPYTEDYSRIEPLPDPPREPDMIQEDSMYHFYGALRPHFADRGDVLISGAGYLIRDAADAGNAGNFAPDGVVAFGVTDPRRIVRRNGYAISEVGKSPNFILEVASRSTGRRDYTVKREGYADYGVREYWRFDPSGGEFHGAPLAGDTLVDGKYSPLEIVSESDTRHWGYSEVLGLELWWYDELLRFPDPGTGEFLLIPEELLEARESAERRADEAQARIAAMEAELRRLRRE